MNGDFEHVAIARAHDVASCHTARLRPGGICGTTHEAECYCGFVQGARSQEEAERIAQRHADDPEEIPVIL